MVSSLTSISTSIYIATSISDGVARSIHFHLFMLINKTAIIFILYVYLFCMSFLSEISNVISCCLPTGKLSAFMHNKFDSKYLISLWLTSYLFPIMSSKLSGMCRFREVGKLSVLILLKF